jgi:hypothetical protein
VSARSESAPVTGHLFPNPARDVVNFNLSQSATHAPIYIAQGALLRQNSLPKAKEGRVDISVIEAGRFVQKVEVER